MASHETLHKGERHLVAGIQAFRLSDLSSTPFSSSSIRLSSTEFLRMDRQLELNRDYSVPTNLLLVVKKIGEKEQSDVSRWVFKQILSVN